MKVKLKNTNIDYSQKDSEMVFDVAFLYLLTSGEFTFGVIIDKSIICLDLKYLVFINNELNKDWKIRFIESNESDYNNFKLIIGPDLVIQKGNLYEIVQKDTIAGQHLNNKLLENVYDEKS